MLKNVKLRYLLYSFLFCSQANAIEITYHLQDPQNDINNGDEVKFEISTVNGGSHKEHTETLKAAQSGSTIPISILALLKDIREHANTDKQTVNLIMLARENESTRKVSRCLGVNITPGMTDKALKKISIRKFDIVRDIQNNTVTCTASSSPPSSP